LLFETNIAIFLSHKLKCLLVYNERKMTLVCIYIYNIYLSVASNDGS